MCRVYLIQSGLQCFQVMSLTWAYKELYELKAREMKNEKRENPRKTFAYYCQTFNGLKHRLMHVNGKRCQRESIFGMQMKSESNEPIKKKPI